ncbi:hypothetical protein ABBQ38_005139 [Trebouxia sp. C0009 RCD-2024]
MSAHSPQELAAFLEGLEDYVPTIPDELTQHYMKLCGFDCEDIRLTRLVSIAAQKFVASIIQDSLELQKQKRTAPQQQLKEQGYNIKDKRLILSPVEIAEALQEHGINVKKPTYYNDDKVP